MALPETDEGRIASDKTISESFFVTGGTMPLDALSYIERQADIDLYQSLKASELCYVLNARQMGKSSLCVRTIQRLTRDGIQAVFLDLTKFGGSNLTADQWYAALVAETGRVLNLRKESLQYYKQNTDFGPMQRFFGVLKEVCLPQTTGNIVIFVDEIDVTRSLPFRTDEFFAGIRECYTGRATDPVLSRLTFCLLGTATPAELIDDSRITPFNIGKRIELTDFTQQEALTLARTLPGGPATLKRVLYWTGGHPYLTQSTCRIVVQSGQDVDSVVNSLFLSHTAQHSEANLTLVRDRILRADVDLFGLLSLYRKILRGVRVTDDDTNPLCDVLKLSGIVRVENGVLVVRNAIYQHIFNDTWVEKHLPGAEVRRQRAAFRRGALLVGGVSFAVVIVVLSLAYFALTQARIATAETRRANQKADDAERSAYATNMNFVSREWESGHLGNVQDIVKDTESYRDRGFEWRYWNRLAHMDLLTLPNAGSPSLFSPDGRFLLTNDNGETVGTAILWDANTYKKLRNLEGSHIAIGNAAFSAAGSRLFTDFQQVTIRNGGQYYSSKDRGVALWDTATGKRIFKITGIKETINAVAISRDGRSLAAAGSDKAIHLFEGQSGKPLRTLTGHTGSIRTIAFSPDGRYLTSGGEDKIIRVWNLTTGAVERILKTDNIVLSLAYSPDGSRLLECTLQSARLWNLQNGREILALNGHSKYKAVTYSPDGRFFATATESSGAQLWDARTGKELQTFIGVGGILLPSVSFSADSTRLVTDSDTQTTKVWNITASSKPFEIWLDNGAFATGSFYSPDGKSIFIAGSDGIVRCIDATTGKEKRRLLGLTKAITCFACSPNGKYIVAASKDKKAILWDAVRGENLFEYLDVDGKSSGTITACAFSRDSRLIVTGSDQGRICIRDVEERTIQTKLQAGTVSSIAWSPDNRYIAVGQPIGTVIIYDVETQKKIRSLAGHQGDVTAISFSSDGTSVLTGSDDETICVWDAATGKKRFTCKGRSGSVHSAVFTPDGRRILASSGQTAKLWDASTGRELLTLSSARGEVTSATMSPDGNRILTSGQSSALLEWIADPDVAHTLAEARRSLVRPANTLDSIKFNR